MGCVYVGDINVNAEMARLGAAWVYRTYASDQGLYAWKCKPEKIKPGCGVYLKLNRFRPGNGDEQDDKVP